MQDKRFQCRFSRGVGKGTEGSYAWHNYPTLEQVKVSLDILSFLIPE